MTRRTRIEFAREVAAAEGLDESLVLRIHAAYDRAYYEASRTNSIPEISGIIRQTVALAGVASSGVKKVIRHLYHLATAPPVPDCSCESTRLRVIDSRALFQQYRCTVCGRSYYCLCDQENVQRLGGLVVINDWRPTLCDRCNGRASRAYSRTLAAGYGAFFALHWREIGIEQLWRMKQWLSGKTAEEVLEARHTESKGNPKIQDAVLEVFKALVANDFAIRRRFEDDLESVPGTIRARFLREAENMIRSQYGVPAIGEGWVSEATLFALINTRAQGLGLEAIAHARLPWLGRQHLDIYIPALRIAIEYMGEQHYYPVEVFGGQTAYDRRRQLDNQKRRLCAENRVTLLEVSYRDAVDESWALKILTDHVQAERTRAD
jgi:hypothetical protein